MVGGGFSGIQSTLPRAVSTVKQNFAGKAFALALCL
jgi:hypothetical protein